MSESFRSFADFFNGCRPSEKKQTLTAENIQRMYQKFKRSASSDGGFVVTEQAMRNAFSMNGVPQDEIDRLMIGFNEDPTWLDRMKAEFADAI